MGGINQKKQEKRREVRNKKEKCCEGKEGEVRWVRIKKLRQLVSTEVAYIVRRQGCGYEGCVLASWRRDGRNKKKEEGEGQRYAAIGRKSKKDKNRRKGVEGAQARSEDGGRRLAVRKVFT